MTRSHPPEEGAGPKGPSTSPLVGRAWDEALAEKQIQDAQRSGLFDDLPGRGKPLDLDALALGPEALASRILKEAAVVPEWIELAGRLDDMEGSIGAAIADAGETFRREQASISQVFESWALVCTTPQPDPPRSPFSRLLSSVFSLSSPMEHPGIRLESELRERLRDLAERRDRSFAICIGQAYALAAVVHRYNQIVPVPSRQRVAPGVDTVAWRFVEQWPALRLEESGEAPGLRVEQKEPPRPCPPAPTGDTGRRQRDPARIAELRVLKRGRKLPPIG